MINVLFIFIGGQSGAGKSTFSKVASDYFKSQGRTCAVISTDNYFCEKPDSISLESYVAETNLDVPELQDFKLLYEHIKTLNQRKSVEKPVFDFSTSKRKAEPEIVLSCEIVIVEGIFVLEFVNKWVKPSRDAINYLPALITSDSWQDTVKLRIQRNLNYGMTKEWLVKQERKNVGPGYMNYTL